MGWNPPLVCINSHCIPAQLSPLLVSSDSAEVICIPTSYRYSNIVHREIVESSRADRGFSKKPFPFQKFDVVLKGCLNKLCTFLLAGTFRILFYLLII